MTIQQTIQKANQHDEKIRKAERERILGLLPREITYKQATELSANVLTDKNGGIKWGFNQAIQEMRDIIKNN